QEQWTGIVVQPGKSESDEGTLRLTRKERIKGRVVDAGGAACPDVEVRFGVAQSDLPLYPLDRYVTRAGGTFSAETLSSHPLLGAFRRSKGESWTMAGPFDPGWKDFNLTLPERFDVIFEPRDSTGEFVKNIQLRICPAGMQNLLVGQRDLLPEDRMEPLPSGAIRVAGLPPGQYEIMVSAPGFALKRETVEILEARTVHTSTLTCACQTKVRITDEEKDSPLEWADVWILPTAADSRGSEPGFSMESPDGQRESWQRTNEIQAENTKQWLQSMGMAQRRKTDAQGAAFFEALHPGDYELVAYHPGFAPAFARIKVPEQGDVDLTMNSGGTIEGEILFEEGAYDPPFTVLLEPWVQEMDEHRLLQRGRLGRGFPEELFPRLVITDSKGRFRAETLFPGEWRVSVFNRWYDHDLFEVLLGKAEPCLASSDPVVRAGKVSSLKIDLGPRGTVAGASISGAVLLNNRPVPEARLELEIAPQEHKVFEDGFGRKDILKIYDNAEMAASGPGPQTPRVVETNESGQYLFSNMSAGAYDLYLRIPPDEGSDRELLLGRRIVLGKSDRCIEDFEVQTGSLSGRVVFEDTKDPLGGVEVLAWTVEPGLDKPRAGLSSRPLELSVVSGHSGTFYFDRLPAGRYFLEARVINREPSAELLNDVFGDPASTTRAVEVLPGVPAGPIVLDLQRPVALRGEIRFAERNTLRDTGLLLIHPADQQADGLNDTFHPTRKVILKGRRKSVPIDP
ncbi:MAG: carboxypeptidase-like regulatory domain-containing protein, partial [Planctomycetes bacterium]|nr:carboxypeptidase-like regulatory domain-containing protein [Planctomycetota bacterium]